MDYMDPMPSVQKKANNLNPLSLSLVHLSVVWKKGLIMHIHFALFWCSSLITWNDEWCQHTNHQWQRPNVARALNSRRAPHTLLSRASYGASFVSEKNKLIVFVISYFYLAEITFHFSCSHSTHAHLWTGEMYFNVEDKDPFIMCGQCSGCWWLGTAMRQAINISNRDIELVQPKYPKWLTITSLI